MSRVSLLMKHLVLAGATSGVLAPTAEAAPIVVPPPAPAALYTAAYDQVLPPRHRMPHYHRGNGGYHVNRMGYGNYTRGRNGGFGGYPAGSAGAQILQEQQERKCQAVPESC